MARGDWPDRYPYEIPFGPTQVPEQEVATDAGGGGARDLTQRIFSHMVASRAQCGIGTHSACRGRA
jgi:hypothetical protein